MPIESTASTFLAWVQGTEGEARTEQAWARRYEQTHLEIFEVYYNGWGDPLRRVAAARKAGTTAARIAHAAQRAQDLIDDAARRFIDGGLLTGPDLPAVLLVGVGTSNGWVADLRGQPTPTRPSAAARRRLVQRQARHFRRSPYAQRLLRRPEGM
jgi:hypothetical protein